MDEQPKQGPQGNELQPGEQTPERPEEGECPTQTGDERHNPHLTSREGSVSWWGCAGRARQEGIEAEGQQEDADRQQYGPDQAEEGSNDLEGLIAVARLVERGDPL